MTFAEFFEKNGEVVGCKIKGHSGYGDAGSDIVCAGVTSAVSMAANMITDVFGYPADVSAVDDTVCLKTDITGDETLQKLYRGLILQLREIAKDYGKNIKLKFTEV